MALIKLFQRYTFSDIHLNTVLQDYKTKTNELIDYFLDSDLGNLKLYDTDQSNFLTLKWNENDSNDRDLKFKVNKADRVIDLTGNLTVELASILNQDLTTDSSVTTFAGITINGDSDLDGSVVINESNADKDFRVEGSGATYTHLLFTDAGNNRVGVNEDAPKALLHIRGATCTDYAGLHPDTYLLIENNDNATIQLQACTTGEARIVFADDDYNPPAGKIHYAFNTDEMNFTIGKNVLVYFKTTGAVFRQNEMEIDSLGAAYFTANSHNADAYFALEEDEALKWTVGMDYTDTLAFTIAEGVPGTNNRFKIAAGGAVTIGGTVGCGKLTVDSGADCSIIIKGTSTGNANLGWIGFYDSDGTTRRGHIGDGSVGDDDIYIGADTGYLRLLAAGYISLGTHTYFPDDVVMSFGASLDYSIGYYSTDDEFQIVDGTTLDSNVRLKLDSSGHFDFGAGNLTTTGTLGVGAITGTSINIICNNNEVVCHGDNVVFN